MEPLGAYVIPVTSLKWGRNELEFSVDWRFFQHFTHSPVEQGLFRIGVVFDKQPDHWHLHFQVNGHLDTECDRCLVPIALPVHGSYDLYVRFDGDDGPDVLNVPRETTRLDISQYLYEYVVLSVPLVKRYDCDRDTPRPCDMDVLARISGDDGSAQVETPWNVLEDILKREDQ